MASLRFRLVIASAWLLFWLLMITVAVQDYLRDGGTALWQPVLWESSSALSATLLLVIQRRFTRAHDHLLATPARWFGLQLLWLPFNCMAFVPLAFGLRHGVYALVGETYLHQPWPQTFTYEALKVSLFFGIFMVILFGILSYQALLQEKERARQASELLRQAQLQRLTQQMQPHFLFNALNTVSSLMHADVNRADATLLQLADVLRATLDAGTQAQTPLSAELRLARGYAQVMAERFVDRVCLSWHIDEAALACQVPVMSLQPLIENVFKHTVETHRQLTHIRIAASREAGVLTLQVDDDQGELATPGSDNAGIGTGNLRERLEALHGSGATLSLTQLSPAGVRAEMRLPCAC